MKPNKGSGQKSLRSKISHEKRMSHTGVKNVAINQIDDQELEKGNQGQNRKTTQDKNK
jgi:hypothetical protein